MCCSNFFVIQNLKDIIRILFKICFFAVPLVNSNRPTVEPTMIDHALFYQTVKCMFVI